MAKILITDDMSGIRQSISLILGSIGHDLVEAENGRRAMDILSQPDHGFDLVITSKKTWLSRYLLQSIL